MLGDAVERTELGTDVIRLPKNLWNPDVIRAVAQCDVVFGYVDTVDGRYLLNALSTYYTIPYFDIGVRLDAVRDDAAKGRIREVCGTVNYLRPGRSSLMQRPRHCDPGNTDIGILQFVCHDPERDHSADTADRKESRSFN